MPGGGGCEFGIFGVTGEKPLLVLVLEGDSGQEGLCRGTDAVGGIRGPAQGGCGDVAGGLHTPVRRFWGSPW